MTRNELLQYFYTLSTERLTTLHKYANLLMMPEDDLLINVNMSQMLDKGFELADTHFPEWTDRSHSDFGRFLLELMCLFSEKDFQYINRYELEGHLPTMTRYSNAYLRALELGYYPTLFSSGSCSFSITVSTGTTDFLLRSGELAVARNGYSFTNIDDVLIPATSDSFVIILHCGAYSTKVVEYGGTPIRTIAKNAVLPKVTIRLGAVQWTRTLLFGRSTSTAKVFQTLPEENGDFSIAFGNGTYGVNPAIGSQFVVGYLEGTEISGDSSIIPCVITKSPSGRSFMSATQISPVFPSVSQESLKSIQASAPQIFSTRKRIINETDCEEFLKSQPEVYKAKAVFWLDTIFFYVIPISGIPADVTIMASLQARVESNQLLGYGVSGNVTTYISVTDMSLDVYSIRGYDLTIIAANVFAAIQDYCNPLVMAEYGKNFVFAEFITHIVSNVTGIQNVVINTIKGASPSPTGFIHIRPSEIILPIVNASVNIFPITNGIQYENGDVTIKSYFVI